MHDDKFQQSIEEAKAAAEAALLSVGYTDGESDPAIRLVIGIANEIINQGRTAGEAAALLRATAVVVQGWADEESSERVTH